jgi:hypothetical protein
MVTKHFTGRGSSECEELIRGFLYGKKVGKHYSGRWEYKMTNEEPYL